MVQPDGRGRSVSLDDKGSLANVVILVLPDNLE